MNLRLMLGCVAAGAAAGILLAPDSGASVRAKISDKIEALKERLYKLKDSKGELDELTDVFKKEITGLKDDTRKRVLQILESMKTAGTELKEQLTS